MRVTESEGPPAPGACMSESDVGRLHHDLRADIWYECFCDERTQAFVWAALPPVDEGRSP